jgi:hypothetical protein
MLLQADAKQLEWVGASYLSQDQVAIDEIWKGTDMHSDNQKRFGIWSDQTFLPSHMCSVC